MLIHLAPKIAVPPRFHNRHTVGLIDFEYQEPGITSTTFEQGGDLTFRRPYPNKRWLVACRRIGRKAVNGILLKTGRHTITFTTVTRWAVSAETILRHRVRYVVGDSDYNATSSEILLWGKRRIANGQMISGSVLQAQPCMEIVPTIRRTGNVMDTLSEDGWLLERDEAFHLPTLDSERLTAGCPGYPFSSRLPQLAHAFYV